MPAETTSWKDLMSILEGIVPREAVAKRSGSLYEFETEYGTVVLQEVDCVGVVYRPQTSTLIIYFEWDLASPLLPVSPKLNSFALEFSDISMKRWSSRVAEVSQDSVGTGQVRSFSWDLRNSFAIELADEEISFMASKCSIRWSEESKAHSLSARPRP